MIATRSAFDYLSTTKRLSEAITRRGLTIFCRIDHAAAVDTVWALMDPALSGRLTGDRHWSPARFRDWFADAILRLLFSVPGQQPNAFDQSLGLS